MVGGRVTLSQPELEGVDPHDPNLTHEQKEMIARECQVNMWYFISVLLGGKHVKTVSKAR